MARKLKHENIWANQIRALGGLEWSKPVQLTHASLLDSPGWKSPPDWLKHGWYSRNYGWHVRKLGMHHPTRQARNLSKDGPMFVDAENVSLIVFASPDRKQVDAWMKGVQSVMDYLHQWSETGV